MHTHTCIATPIDGIDLRIIICFSRWRCQKTAEDTPEDNPTKVYVATPTNVHTEDTVDDDPGLLIVFGDEMDIHTCLGFPSVAGVGGAHEEYFIQDLAQGIMNGFSPPVMHLCVTTRNTSTVNTYAAAVV